MHDAARPAGVAVRTGWRWIRCFRHSAAGLPSSRTTRSVWRTSLNSTP